MKTSPALLRTSLVALTTLLASACGPMEPEQAAPEEVASQEPAPEGAVSAMGICTPNYADIRQYHWACNSCAAGKLWYQYDIRWCNSSGTGYSAWSTYDTGCKAC